MRITTADIINITGYGSTNNLTDSILYRMGSAHSNEVYNDNAIVFRSPGLVSLPVSTGTFNSAGVFTSTNSSDTCSQALVLENNSHWYGLGTRDTRNQPLLTATNTGETRLFAEGNPSNSIYLDINGNCWITSNHVIQQPTQGTAITLTKQDGSVSLLTTDNNKSGGVTEGLTISPSSNGGGISLVNQYGFILIDASGVTLSNGNASLTLTPSGDIKINGTTISLSASLIAIAGSVATCIGADATPLTLPGPSANSALYGLAAGAISSPVVGLCAPSTTVFIGP